jgi:hypothetical protein
LSEQLGRKKQLYGLLVKWCNIPVLDLEMMRESQLGGQTCFFLGGMVLLMLRQQKFHTASPSLNQKNETDFDKTNPTEATPNHSPKDPTRASPTRQIIFFLALSLGNIPHESWCKSMMFHYLCVFFSRVSHHF